MSEIMVSMDAIPIGRRETHGLANAIPKVGAYREVVRKQNGLAGAMQSGLAHAIKVSNLCKSFGSTKALDNVTLSITRGSSFAVLGPNGAGKTTLIGVLGTLVRPSSGSVKVNGVEISDELEEVKRQIGVVSHNTLLYDELTARENLAFYAGLYGADADIDEILGKARLLYRADDLVGTFSRGMKQRLSIARAMLHKPKILLLDEPTQGLDARSKQDFYKTIDELNSKGATMVLVTHSFEEAQRLCSECAVMDKGKVIFKGETKEAEQVLAGLMQ